MRIVKCKKFKISKVVVAKVSFLSFKLRKLDYAWFKPNGNMSS